MRISSKGICVCIDIVWCQIYILSNSYCSLLFSATVASRCLRSHRCRRLPLLTCRRWQYLLRRSTTLTDKLKILKFIAVTCQCFRKVDKVRIIIQDLCLIFIFFPLFFVLIGIVDHREVANQVQIRRISQRSSVHSHRYRIPWRWRKKLSEQGLPSFIF